MDWNSIANVAREAFREAVNEWIRNARIAGGTINGPAAELRPGSLVSGTSMEATMMMLLQRSNVAAPIAQALAKTLSAAWQDWAAGFQLRSRAFPTFAAVPGPSAPATMAQPIGLRSGSSAGETSLGWNTLSGRLQSALQGQTRTVAGNMEKPMEQLAQWVDGSFQDWKGLAMLTGLTGQGSVPTFAPPYVPVGPVIQGSVVSSGPLFAGPRFGRVVTR